MKTVLRADWEVERGDERGADAPALKNHPILKKMLNSLQKYFIIHDVLPDDSRRVLLPSGEIRLKIGPLEAIATSL